MNCPLCNKYLLEVGFGDVICQTRIKFDGKATLSHYEKRDGKVYWYMPPYQIINHENETTVMKVDEENTRPSSNVAGGFYSQPNFKKVFVMEGHFPPTEPEKLLKRIKLLTIFS
jgi:hypothetical protein